MLQCVPLCDTSVEGECYCSGGRRPVKVLLTAVGILAISGATAGLLGIGGALIFNPFLLQLGMDPRVSCCLCNC